MIDRGGLTHKVLIIGLRMGFNMNTEIITLIIAIIGTINTIVLFPLFKFVIYVYKEIAFMKGHLGIKD